MMTTEMEERSWTVANWLGDRNRANCTVSSAFVAEWLAVYEGRLTKLR